MKDIELTLDTSPQVEQQDEVESKGYSDTLGGHLQDKWNTWSQNKRSIEEGWMEDLRMFNQQNDPDVVQLSKFHSHIYIGTARKNALQAYARISDVFFGTRGAHWGLENTPIPKSMAKTQLAQDMAEAMKVKCELMEKEIRDQQVDLNYEAHVKEAVMEGCVLGTGCIKGIVPSVKKTKTWQQVEVNGVITWKIVETEQPFPSMSSPSIFNLYPDAYATTTEDMSGVFELHLLNLKQFSELKSDSRFDESKINEVIRAAPRGNHTALWHETERRDLAKIQDATANQAEKFDVLEYWGQVSGDLLGVHGIEGLSETEVYWANVWVCNGRTLLAMIMPMENQRIPYNFFRYTKVSHQFWGVGAVRLGRMTCLVQNGLIRAMLDGLAFAAVPQFEVFVSMLRDGQDPSVLLPGMVWVRDNGDPQYPAVRAIPCPVPTGNMLQVGELVRTLNEEETSLPAYSYGADSPSINDTTARGTAMRLNAANLPTKTIIKNVEDDLIIPLISSHYDWNMQWSDKEEIKGDMKTVVHATSTLLTKEEKAQSLGQALEITGLNPEDAKRVDRDYLLKEFFKALEIDVERAIPDVMPEKPEEAPDPIMMAKLDQILAQTELAKANAEATHAKTVATNTGSLYSAIQAAVAALTNAGAVDTADQLLASAGFVDANGTPLANIPAQGNVVPLPVQQNTSPMMPPRPIDADAGVNMGIETMRNDGQQMVA